MRSTTAAAIVDNEFRMVWRGKQSDALLDETEALDLEGAFRSSKTTIGLWREFNAAVKNPGIHSLLSRWTDDATFALLRPLWRKILDDTNTAYQWRSDEGFDELANGSRVYIRGLKAPDVATRYAKFRGLTLSRVYIDQAEEVPRDIYQELKARLSQSRFDHAITITPNAVDEDHWIAKEFPDSNHMARRRLIQMSVYDNAHNLSEATIRNLEETYPVGHAKHRPAILGLRGLNVIGEAVYGPLDPTQPETAVFQRSRHEQSLSLNPALPLYEALDFGRSHPCVVWAQYTPFAELRILGGILGQNLFLEDFAPIVQQYRQRWFPNALEVLTCCDPAGSHEGTGLKNNAIQLLIDLGFNVQFKDDSNNPAIRLAMIERIAGYMRRRSPTGEAFAVNNTNFIRLSSAHGVTDWRFLTDGFEAGYVWDNHLVSVGSKPMRRPKKDGWYDHGQNCVEYLEHNFGGVQPTWEQVNRRAVKISSKQAERDYEPTDRKVARFGGRGGYR
jgi:hypothetical protein